MFAELHQLAQAASLLISVVAEGDNLRVTVTGTPANKANAGMHPLVLVGTPEELDRDFAQAVQIFEPSALPLLEQARVAANANGNKGSRALKAPTTEAKAQADADADAAGTPAKRGRGRPPKNASTPAPEQPSTPTSEDATDSEDVAAPQEVDPRQMSLVDADARPSAETPTVEPAAEAALATSAPHAAPASTDPRDTGLDLPI